MQESLQNPAPQEKAKPSPLSILAAVLVFAFLVAGIVLFLRERESPTSAHITSRWPPAIRMTDEEAAYAKTIRIENIALSRAENFIHQEVTFLDADAVNTGARAAEALMVTVEFADDLNQVVLRETRSTLGPPSSPLAPGQSRHFQISFDRVPSSWNMQPPTVQVSYLRLTSLK